MRFTTRYYILADDGTIRRLARAMFFAILEQKTPVPFVELHGQRVRLATIQVQLLGRRPVAVADASFGYITFDADGYFDSTEWDNAARTTIEAWRSPGRPKSQSLLDGRDRFAARRRQHEHTWQPDDELRRRLFATATGNA